MTTDTASLPTPVLNRPSAVRRARAPQFKAARPWVLTAIGLLIAALYLFPIYWMYISGFKLSGEIFSRPPTFFPENPSLSAFEYIFDRENVVRYIRNSFIIAISVTAITLALGTGAAYSLARIRSRWLDAALLFILVSQVLPQALMATPMFVIFRQLDILNTQLAVILATATKTVPFAIIILRTSFQLVPKDLEEAARVDGCTRFRAFLVIALPLARTGLLVAGALTFILAYGEFVYAISLLTSTELQPATVGLYGFVGAEFADWNNVMAFASLFVTPVMLLFILLQRRIVQGLTAGALK